MSYENILFEKEDHLGIISINRPKVLNALNSSTIRELIKIFDLIRKDSDLWGVVLTGVGDKAFVAGADIGEFDLLSPAKARDLSGMGQRLTRDMEQLGIPIIAAVNGYCLGGGFELALACDFILASDNAVFGLPEVSLGLIPGWGGTQRLARWIGPNRARQLVYSAAKLKANEAKDWGIVNEVFPQADLITQTKELLVKMNQNSPFAVAQAKRSLNEGLQTDLDRGLILEQNYFGFCFTSKDLKEGIAAFQEKRKPKFKGE